MGNSTNGYVEDDNDDGGGGLSSPAALEAALEATDVSNESLRDLAAALAAEANSGSCSSHLLLRRRRPEKNDTNERRPHLVHWTAIARACAQPHWPPPPAIPAAAGAGQGSGPGGGDFSTSLDSHHGDGIRLLRRWMGLRLPVPCKHLLTAGCGGGHGVEPAPVTCLTYLPLAMLLVSGHSDGRVRLWDPCARKHKLAPPPPPTRVRYSGGSTGESRKWGEDSGGRERDRGRHQRLHPGHYAETKEEWTEKGKTFGCVAIFGAVRAAETSGGRQGGGAGGGGGRFLKVQAVDSIVLPGGSAASLVVCDPEGARAARAIDRELPWDPASAGECMVRYTQLTNCSPLCGCPIENHISVVLLDFCPV